MIARDRKNKAAIREAVSVKQTQETLALLKLLAIGNMEIDADEVKPVADVVARLRANRCNR
jgi:hypothetical protein